MARLPEALSRTTGRRQPQLHVAYTEIPGYGHLDTFLGRGAALDVFGRSSNSSANDGYGGPGGRVTVPVSNRTASQEATHAAVEVDGARLTYDDEGPRDARGAPLVSSTAGPPTGTAGTTSWPTSPPRGGSYVSICAATERATARTAEHRGAGR